MTRFKVKQWRSAKSGSRLDQKQRKAGGLIDLIDDIDFINGHTIFDRAYKLSSIDNKKILGQCTFRRYNDFHPSWQVDKDHLVFATIIFL